MECLAFLLLKCTYNSLLFENSDHTSSDHLPEDCKKLLIINSTILVSVKNLKCISKLHKLLRSQF